MKPEELKNVAVIGGGTMGLAIAQVFAQAGIEARLVDVKPEVLERAMRIIKSNLETLSGHGRFPASEIHKILARIHPSGDTVAAVKDAQFVVEAVSEVPDVKKKIFDILDKNCPPDTILASNTSTLDVFSIVEIKRADRLIMTHWFNPAHIIPLVEIAGGAKTSPETLEFTVALHKMLGKRPIVLKQFQPGFIVNRIQQFLTLMVLEMIRSGVATAEDIDAAVKTSLGIRLPIIGMVQALDFMGLNLIYDVMKAGGINPHPIIEEKVKAGQFGASTSKGMYDYGNRTDDQILQKRDKLFLKVLDNLEAINAFEPV